MRVYMDVRECACCVYMYHEYVNVCACACAHAYIVCVFACVCMSVWVCVCACECVRVHAEAIINLMTKFMCKYPHGRTQARIVVVLGRRQNFFRRPFSAQICKKVEDQKKVFNDFRRPQTFVGPRHLPTLPSG